ncbi:hypothetical protein PGTUg99_025774 [Puccinia graminis f. sp. tritici]|uniref:Uncharacterized protein n=1 Tax=Puccinia graminis f. sp. tritici TaxID=56615 RepID=A0A5B0SLU4_PUCGR|nr:hypothetical protein PGTUg99_025774 [Puccinia graminis f. sp. tritici]
MKAILLWNILFGVLASGLANDSHLEGNDVNEEIKSSATHHLSKRDIDLHGNFPGLGGNDLAGKVFTTTGSRITQSNNVLPTRNRKALSFIDNPNVQQKEGINPALQVNPLQQAIKNNRALLASVTESKESDHLPLIHESVDVKHTPQDPPSSEKDSVNADATVNLARRGLVRRSLFEQQLLEKRELKSAAGQSKLILDSFFFSLQKLTIMRLSLPMISRHRIIKILQLSSFPTELGRIPGSRWIERDDRLTGGLESSHRSQQVFFWTQRIIS